MSFVVALASDAARPVIAVSSEVLPPFGLLDAEDEGRCFDWSCMLCIEFCLALEAVGRLFAGGEMRVVDLGSKVPCIGEDAGLGVFEIFDAAVLGREALASCCDRMN